MRCAKNKENASDSDRLKQLFDLRWEQVMMENPEFATEVGYPGQNDRWSDASLDAIQKQKSGSVDAQKVLIAFYQRISPELESGTFMPLFPVQEYQRSRSGRGLF